MVRFKYKYYRLSETEKQLLLNKMIPVLRVFNVKLAVVFGSFVELDSFRDLDVAVYGFKLGFDDVIRLSVRLEEELGIPVDVVLLEELSPQMRINILLKGKVILEEEPGLYEYLLLNSLDEKLLLEQA